ncbi:MAG: hypothetical protein PHC88_12875 [Terrimicrobiaceae bacterium]|nr:hypothetical protein [Terrimicrobiaceae bacterium]
MSPSSATSIPKAPAERTFVIAVTLLSLAAIAQLIAVVVALAPQLDLERIGRSLASRPASAAQSAANDVAKSQQANALMDEAGQFRAKGNFQGAIEAMTEADRLVPNKPGILIQLASDYVSLQKNAEATAVLNRIVALPPGADPADAPFREQARAALAQLGGATSAAAPADTKNSAGMRDDVGIPIGSVMGIIKAELLDGDPGQKNLRVATKGASGQKIDAQKFLATAYFYEQDDHGQIQQNDSPHVTEWLSLPATWTNGEPEIFQTKYRLPAADRGDLPPLQYYGYVVAIYYNGELQDSRADPVSLLDQFAPPLHKDATTTE